MRFSNFDGAKTKMDPLRGRQTLNQFAQPARSGVQSSKKKQPGLSEI